MGLKSMAGIGGNTRHRSSCISIGKNMIVSQHISGHRAVKANHTLQKQLISE